ncbi:hypothetical protein [Yinghuangia sp. YIM S10712]|uniref:hypothetical protein n=1 Tax=Yinghuangia sp. YIM S10712 TaxID=3436930 RepID=UPI003F53E341
MIGIGVVVLVVAILLCLAMPPQVRRRLLPKRFFRRRPRGFVWKASDADGNARALEDQEQECIAALGCGSLSPGQYREAMERLARLDERRPVRVPQARNA